MSAQYTHCGWCGHPFDPQSAWPRTCAACGKTSYVNPLPVAVAVVPVASGGLLVIRRAIEPRKGQLALPGGFIDIGEDWRHAAARELREEAQIEIDPASITEHCVLSAPDGTVLIFGIAPTQDDSAWPAFTPNHEVSERHIIRSPDEPLAFPLHRQAARRWFER
jgi:ADP-ribose pyrophosphatase YjhB (NUDIX family)